MSKPEGYRNPRVQANPDDLEEFRARLPRQVEHCLRMTLERLQKQHRDLTAAEIEQLSQAAYYLTRISRA